MEKNNKDEKQQKLPVMRAYVSDISGGEDYDFSVTAVPFDNGQVNYDWTNDVFYNQVLVPTAEATRTARLESGLNLFDNHPYFKDAADVLGISRRYEFSPEGLKLFIKWGSRADEAIRNDVKEGIIKTVSIEGDIYSYEVTRNPNELPIYKATDWEPTSVSLAPVPQDIGSQIEVQRKIKDQIKKENTQEEDKSIPAIKSITSKF